ncbi:sugar phosphate nucleotidyltransferase [Oerskovia sp. M15]
MAAIGLAAAVLEQRHGDVVIGSFAADQVITGQAAFEQAVREGVEAARAGFVVTVGIAASRPSTAFGYVRSGASLGLAGRPPPCTPRVHREARRADRSALRALGEYRWNAGMFISRTSVLLGHLADQRPELHDGLRRIAEAWDTADRDRVLAEEWPGLEKIAIDHAVAEPVAAVGGVAVVPGNFGWDDVGDFNSRGAAARSGRLGIQGPRRRRARGPAGERGLGGRPGQRSRRDDPGPRRRRGRRHPDALLVTTRARAQQVKSMVDAVRERGLDELL